MDRLFAYIGNDANLVRCAVHQVIKPLEGHLAGAMSGWGMGYEQESQFLLRKRPQSTDLDLMGLAGDLRSDSFVLHLRGEGQPQATPADMNPFRFRSWLFAQTGDLSQHIERKDALEIPDFLTRNIRGCSNSEQLFHRFLVHLKRERVPLQHPIAPTKPTLTALARTVAEAQRWAREGGEEALRLGVVLSNGRCLYVASVGEQFQFFKVSGVESCPICEGQPLFAGHRPKKTHHRHLRAALLVSVRGEGGGGDCIGDGEVAAVGVDLKLHRFKISALL